MSNNDAQPQTPAWWTYGHVWLVIAGPLIVVIAGFVTFYLAAQRPDPVISRDAAATQPAPSDDAASLAPAVQARNHAATGRPPSAP